MLQIYDASSVAYLPRGGWKALWKPATLPLKVEKHFAHYNLFPMTVVQGQQHHKFPVSVERVGDDLHVQVDLNTTTDQLLPGILQSPLRYNAEPFLLAMEQLQHTPADGMLWGELHEALQEVATGLQYASQVRPGTLTSTDSHQQIYVSQRGFGWMCVFGLKL